MVNSKADMKCFLGVASLLLLQSLQQAVARHIDKHESVELVVKISRHGARTPTFYPPGDPNNEFWKDSRGQLTNEGKVQLFEMGKSFRSNYKGLLNRSYEPEEILAMSTDIDRTIMSCQAFLAGLYPPKGDQVWNPKIDWQPIPVHTLPYDLDSNSDNILKVMLQHCQGGTENDVFFSQHKNTFERIQTATGVVYKICYDPKVYALSDTFIVEHFYKMPLPYGLEPYYEDIEKLANDYMVRIFGNPVVSSRYNGPLYEHLIQILKTKADNVISQKAISFCMHDSNVLSFWASLGENYPLTNPAFGASIVIELIKTMYDGQESYKVRVYSIPTPGALRQLVQIKGCGYKCSVDEFIEQLRIASVPQSTSVCPCSQN